MALAVGLPGPPAKCGCCKVHNPKPLTVDRHHIQPESWNGPSTPDNLIVVCPTTHHSTHSLIDLYVFYGRKPTTAEMRARFGVLPSLFIRRLAAQAWDKRPAHPTPTSLAWGHTH